MREDIKILKCRVKNSENILILNIEKIMVLISDNVMTTEDKFKELESILTINNDEFTLFKENDKLMNTSAKKKNL